jgi:SAM-dependent methyltransferase
MRGPETEKAHIRRTFSNFYKLYMSGQGLDIGYKGNPPVFEPVADNVIGVDLDYPGYDGRTLPFADNSQDFVYASHCIEHIDDYKSSIREWYRVTKIGGYVILCVPHQYLYEKQNYLPSKFNEDHKRLYTPSSLLWEIEDSLEPNSYRVRYLQESDFGFDYSIGPGTHSEGEYQIECVIQKIETPVWSGALR